MVDFEALVHADKIGQLLGIHPKTVLRMARAGNLPAIRIGRYWRFRRSDLDDWLKSKSNFEGRKASSADPHP
jgi:excisionase family DNA binding protein